MPATFLFIDKGLSLKSIILIDFDGVIRHWQSGAIEKVENRLGLPNGTLFSVAFSESLLLPTITGQQSHTCWTQKVRDQLSKKFDSAIGEELIEAWENTIGIIDRDFINSIRSNSPNSKLVLVTNATDKLSQDIYDSNLSESFDFIINSSVVMVAKPDAAFFARSIELLGCRFGDCVFIDDTLKNVQAAKELGILSLHHESVDGTLEFIEANCI